MANVLYLLMLLASLAVCQSAADDACDSEECLPSPGPVCAHDEETGNMALFADECVLLCTNCRTDTAFEKVNRSLCSSGVRKIAVCPSLTLNQDEEEANAEGPDDEIAVIQIDAGQEGSDGFDGLPPFFRDSNPMPLPSPLLSMGRELVRRLVMSSQPEQPHPPPERISFIKADVKVDVTINMRPPASRFAPPPPLVLPPPVVVALPRLPLLAPLPPPPPPQSPELRHKPEQLEFYSVTSPAARPSLATAVASLVAMAVAAIHI